MTVSHGIERFTHYMSINRFSTLLYLVTETYYNLKELLVKY